MMRSVVPIILLLASIGGPAAAMDPSAMEETNCLMACDANQEHCGAGQAPLNRNRSVAAHLSHPIDSSLARSTNDLVSRTQSGYSSATPQGPNTKSRKQPHVK